MIDTSTDRGNVGNALPKVQLYLNSQMNPRIVAISIIAVTVMLPGMQLVSLADENSQVPPGNKTSELDEVKNAGNQHFRHSTDYSKPSQDAGGKRTSHLVPPSPPVTVHPILQAQSPKYAPVGTSGAQDELNNPESARTLLQDAGRATRLPSITADRIVPTTSSQGSDTSRITADESLPEGSDFFGVSASYKLGPGDELIVVDPSMGTPDQPYTAVPKVGPDGNVIVYPVGLVRASGRTLVQLNAIVNEKAREFQDNPHIAIGLQTQHPISVYVLGDVVSPGLWNSRQPPIYEREKQLQEMAAPSSGGGVGSGFLSMQTPTGYFTPKFGTNQVGVAMPPSPPPNTVPISEPSITPFTALTAIQLAGGVTITADIRHITVQHRGNSKKLNLDLWKLLAEGDLEQDIVLQEGDLIYVPMGGPAFRSERLGLAVDQFRYVRVWGEVRTPGIYILRPNDDLFSIIARAGGFTTVADATKVELSRLNRNGTISSRTIPMVQALRGEDTLGRAKVMPGDVIIARSSFSKKYGPSIANALAIGLGAVVLLYLSRNIVDKSIPNNTNNTNGTTNSTSVVRLGF